MNTEALKQFSPEALDLAKKALPDALKIAKGFLDSQKWPEIPADERDELLDLLARGERLDDGLRAKAQTKESARTLLKSVLVKAIELAIRAAPLAL